MSAPAWRLLADGLAFPEGPAFAPDGSLWFVEYKGGALVRWRQGRLERFVVSGSPNGIAIHPDGRVWFCDAGERAIRRWADGACETLAGFIDGEPLYKPNDLCFDQVGNLLFTCPGDSRTESLGYVCCLPENGEVRRVGEGFCFPNGLALSGGDLIVAESYRQRLWRGRWDAASRTWMEPRVWAGEQGFTPWGKPVAALMKQWYSRMDRP